MVLNFYKHKWLQLIFSTLEYSEHKEEVKLVKSFEKYLYKNLKEEDKEAVWTNCSFKVGISNLCQFSLFL